ncbi:DNA-binding transcriptional ArsR family regulator [Streptacidiphilus sp. MAP12-20]|uniref:ArsR/SmtB family transcription factor n=1 Tax=Streptacidiphilus sp. MAP12-20 TaxID=3156299 RepID=UPI00351158E0
MSHVNPYGDFEILDPSAMRALAHPVRLAILETLQRDGPATATQLAPYVGATPTVTSWHLRHLAGFGLVRDAEPAADRRQRRWEAASNGFRFQAGEDAESQSAARMLSRQMFARYGELPQRWLLEVEPQLEAPWTTLAGLSNTVLYLHAEELADLVGRFEELLAPYVNRTRTNSPPGTRRVRWMTYLLPDAQKEPE